VVPPDLQQDNGKLIVYEAGRLYVVLCRFCRRTRVKELSGGDEYCRRRRRPAANKKNEKFRLMRFIFMLIIFSIVDVLTYST
jgi:hypothetical protein